MNRLTRFSSAAFGMVLLAGLAYYQGNPEVTDGEHASLVGTAVIDSSGVENSIEAEESTDAPATEKAAQASCDPSKNPENPDFEDCEKLTHQ